VTDRQSLGDLAPGTRLLDRFEITREVGRGGYSIVYAAIDHRIGGPVAIKVLVPPPVAALEARERLRREVETFCNVRHPNVVGVHDFLEQGPLSFVVMDLVDGPDLATWIADRGALDPDRVVAIGRDISAALVEAHRAGVLHRDIKPANILLGSDGRARLTDFGAARIDSSATLTRTGGLVGTVAYLAPEVWLGERPDARADLYALGLTLFEALTGQLPERPSSHLPPTPEPGGYRPGSIRPGLPSWLDQAIATATVADPRRRFTTAAQFAETFATGRAPVAKAPVTGPVPTPGPVRLAWSMRLLIAGVVIVGLGAGLAAPIYYLLTPVFGFLLFRAARRDAARPAEHPGDSARWPLTPGQRATVAAVPPGPASDLLDDVLTLAQRQIESATSAPARDRWRHQLAPAVDAAIEAASDLTEVDELLRRMTRVEGRPRQLPDNWWDTIAHLDRTRDTLAMALLDVVGALGRARGADLADLDGAGLRLRQAVGELVGDLDRRAEALKLLETSPR